MKIKYLLLSVIASSSLVFVSCGEDGDKTNSKDNTAPSEKTTEKEEVEEIVETDEEIEEYADHSIEGQWNDIIFQVGTGKRENLEFYLDVTAPTFSQEEWDYIDFSYPEYEEAFAQYDSFEDVPEAEYFAEGARVVEVYFETESDGMVFESAVMIYLLEEDGLLWIIGSEMAG